MMIYKQRSVSLLLTLLSLFLSTHIIKPHGFSLDTLITMKNAKERLPLIELARLIVAKKRRSVRAYEEVKKKYVNKHIEGVGFSETNSYCRLLFTQDPVPILCTPKQSFYRMPDRKWVGAHQLRMGDQLLCSDNRTATLSNITLVQEKLPVCTLQVNAAHTFLVGRLEIVTHNTALPLEAFLRFTWKFGAAGGAGGACTFDPVKIAGGILIGGTVGLIYDFCTRKTYAAYYSAEGQQTIDLYAQEINRNNTPVTSARYEKIPAAVARSSNVAVGSEKSITEHVSDEISISVEKSDTYHFPSDEAPDFVAFSANGLPERSALTKAAYQYVQEPECHKQLIDTATSHSPAMTYQEELTQLGTALFEAECDDIERYQARITAIEQTQEHGACIQRSFDCTQAACNFAEEYGIAETRLKTGYMNAYASQLHTEFLEQLNAAAQLHTSFDNATYAAPFLDVIGCGVSFGIEANEKQQVAVATHWADMVWQAIDIASAVVEGVGNGFWNLGAGSIHLAQGAIRVTQGAVQAAAHPIDSIVTVVNGFEKVISLCAHSTRSAIQFVCCNEENPIASLKRKVRTLIGQTEILVQDCYAQINATPMRDKVKSVATIITEFVPGKVLRILRCVQKSMSPFLTTLLRAMRRESTATGLAAVAGKAEPLLMHGAQAATAIGGPGKEVVHDALKLYHGNLIKNLELEIIALRTAFDNKVKGFAESATQFIKVDYKHILGMELSFNKKGRAILNGFHHDFMNAIENSGIIGFTKKVIHETGCYSADLIVDGVRIPQKTFFPPHWSREEVAKAIYEAYENFMHNGALPLLQSNGKYKIDGKCKAGIKIEMFITQKGMIKTAYPKL